MFLLPQQSLHEHSAHGATINGMASFQTRVEQSKATIITQNKILKIKQESVRQPPRSSSLTTTALQGRGTTMAVNRKLEEHGFQNRGLTRSCHTPTSRRISRCVQERIFRHPAPVPMPVPVPASAAPLCLSRRSRDAVSAHFPALPMEARA